MDFDYTHLTDPCVTTLERHIRLIVDNIDNYHKGLYNEFDSISFVDDIFGEISDYTDKVDNIISADVASDICCQIDDLNSQGEEHIIEAIRCDKDAYNYVIAPSETVINFYKFLYEL